MAKRNREARPPLAHYWMPLDDYALLPNGAGEPVASVASTYEFDAPYFETDLLPRFLGLAFDDSEAEPSFIVEREEKLACGRVAVLVDAAKFARTQSTLRWDQMPIAVPGGIQHSKVTLLVWERLVRVIVSSANLTRAGYRRNREIFAALDFFDHKESVPRSLLQESIELLRAILGWARAAPTTSRRVADTLDQVKDRVSGWTDIPLDFTARLPRLSLAATLPARGGARCRSSLDELLGLWGDRSANQVLVASPFFGTIKHSEGDRVLERLAAVRRRQRCEGNLFVPRATADGNTGEPCVAVPQRFAAQWRDTFGDDWAWVYPAGETDDGQDASRGQPPQREMHLKAVALCDAQDVFLMFGSSNFTPRGMGVGAFNIEANLVYRDRNDEKRDGKTWWSRLEIPKQCYSLKELQCQPLKDGSEDEPPAVPVAPAFFAWATYAPGSGKLCVELDRTRPEPQDWSISLGERKSEPLFQRTAGAPAAERRRLEHVFPEPSREVNITSLIVRWWDAQGTLQSEELPVSVEDRDELPPPEEFRALSPDAIIDCLISGKSPAHWLDDEQRKKSRERRSDKAGFDSHKVVDPSGYLLYRVRRFGRALGALGDRLAASTLLPDAVRYRILQDPLGPLGLARALVRGGDEPTTWTAALQAEHRVFLLTEIALALRHLRNRCLRGLRGRVRQQVEEVFRTAAGKVAALVDQQLQEPGQVVADNLRAYLEQVQTETGQVQSLAAAPDINSQEAYHGD